MLGVAVLILIGLAGAAVLLYLLLKKIIRGAYKE